MQIENELLLSGLAIVVLLLLSAMFSGSETALTSTSRARMYQSERRGDRRAAIVNRLIARKERLIGGILLGNNLVNILASSLATSVLIVFFGNAGVAYATIIMTVLVLIFSEVLPKTYALQQPDRVSRMVAPLIAPIISVFAPVVTVVQAIVGGTLRLFGVELRDGGHIVDTADELRGTFALHARSGGIVKADKDMLDSILDLPSVDVSEIMVHRRSIVTIDADQPIATIVAEALASPYTRIPLWRDNAENIVGILHAKDLLRAVTEHEDDFADFDVMELARDPWFVPETTTLLEQLNAFRARHEHFALVVDEYGALMGLVTLEDILEEIVGEIADEHDIVRVGRVVREPAGTYVVEGGMTVRDLNRLRDWHLPEDEAATIAGLLIHEAKHIPDVGERFQFHGFGFEVLRRQRNRVVSLRLRPPAATGGAAPRSAKRG